MTRTRIYSISLKLLLVLFIFPTVIHAQGHLPKNYVPELLVCSYPGQNAKDSIYLEYDWDRKITSITVKFGGARGVPRKFKIHITYNEDGQMAVLTETPIDTDAYPQQTYRFTYSSVFLDKIWFDDGQNRDEVKVEYSAPTNTYNIDYKNLWQNFVFDKGDLLAKRIKGYEVFAVHRNEEEKPGIMRYVRQQLPFQIVSETLGSSQLVFYVLCNYQVDLLEYNYQNIFLLNKRDEYGRIAQIDFSSDQLGTFQTTTIDYKPLK